MTTDARPDREAAKRRIMFVAGEDSYFLAYTALLLLADLKCTSVDDAFVEPGKIAYLADFVGNASDLALAVRADPVLDHPSRTRLTLLYDRAVARRAPLERLIEAIARRELIAATRASGEVDRVYLLNHPAVVQLLSSPLYQSERAHIARLRKLVPKVRTMTLTTLKEKLFGRHGVRTWGD